MASKPSRSKNTVQVKNTKENLELLSQALVDLVETQVLVGFPDDTSDRDNEGLADKDLTNAALGYIHDNGAPEARIPQREFMRPGIEAVQDDIADLLGRTARNTLKGGGPEAVHAGLTQVGFKAANSIKRTINEGVPPPLSAVTLRNRMRKGRKNGGGARKGAMIELDRRDDGQTPSVEFAKPLVDTAQMRNAVTFVLRNRKGKDTETKEN
ncbi:virion morphogenesis protein [Edwardsiella phage vB_EpM_ZHS]|jgi:hypothetical protein|nr:virion morphogenesis protein [Edwardsiella phage vB_EpM_ZHS]